MLAQVLYFTWFVRPLDRKGNFLLDFCLGDQPMLGNHTGGLESTYDIFDITCNWSQSRRLMIQRIDGRSKTLNVDLSIAS